MVGTPIGLVQRLITLDLAKFTYEQYATVNQQLHPRFIKDPILPFLFIDLEMAKGQEIKVELPRFFVLEAAAQWQSTSTVNQRPWV